ncbi:MAG: AMP-binding protein [Caldisphaera sp.]|nr:AMP-binding protein [Caldisphaera sp.]
MLKDNNYTEFNSRIRKLASELETIGLKKDSKIGIIGWNTNYFLESLFATPYTGGILHTINLRLSSQEIVYTMNYVKDDAIIIRDEFVQLVEKIAKSVPFYKTMDNNK